jgi:hypothetical protein
MRGSAIISLVFVFGCLPYTFGAIQYVVANDNNLNNNHVTVYRLDTSTGTLAQVASLATRGAGLGGIFQNNNYANIEQAVSADANCIFALDAATSDIAAFSKATGYSLVGNYSNAELDSSYDGGTLALTPNGKFLYGSYSGSGNVGAWTVNSDCSLTFIAAYPAADFGEVGVIKTTPSGTALIVVSPVLYSGADLLAIDSAFGTLTDLGFLQFCQPDVCLLGGVDITKDSKLAVFSADYENPENDVVPIALTVPITPHGLGSPRYWSLGNSAGVLYNHTPILSAAAYAGNGNLYFGMDNGVVTTTFTEKPQSVTMPIATMVAPTTSNGVVAVTGSVMVVAEYPNQIGVFSINADGSVTELSTTTIQSANPGLFSISVFPDNR